MTVKTTTSNQGTGKKTGTTTETQVKITSSLPVTGNTDKELIQNNPAEMPPIIAIESVPQPRKK